ncbi:MAG: hypothetical protein V1844_14050 [Pseudomonadota bacterium]
MQEGPGLSLVKRTDVHIADKESPAQGNDYGWTATHASNTELVKQLSPKMQAKITNYGQPIAESQGH